MPVDARPVRSYCNVCNSTTAPDEPSPWICYACCREYNNVLGFAEWPKLIQGLGSGQLPPIRRYSVDDPVLPALAERIAQAETSDIRLAIAWTARRVAATRTATPHWQRITPRKRVRLCDD